MRIALYADVHGNLPALEALLAHAELNKAGECWNLGDMVGYGPFPNEVVGLLRRRCSSHILGNHDIKCASPDHAVRMRAAGKDPDKIFSFDWTNRELLPENAAFIRTLDFVRKVEIAGVRLLLTHGSPRATEDTLTPRTSASKFRALAREVTVDGVTVVICGHTHEFFDRSFDGVRFINPGGAGRSFNGDPRAAYTILDVSSAGVQVEHYRVAYSLEALASAMKQKQFPDRLIRTLIEARSLDELEGIKQENVPDLIQRACTLGKVFIQKDTHAAHVARLALRIFDGLQPWHGLTWRERAYLHTAALLHDIGWVNGQKAHHKASRDLILKDRTLPLDDRERVLVALTARYHRRSLPEEGHKFTKDLTVYDRETLDVCAAFLRMADGLDRSQRSLVADVAVTVEAPRIIVQVSSLNRVNISAELKAAAGKADLLERIFGFKVIFKAVSLPLLGRARDGEGNL